MKIKKEDIIPEDLISTDSVGRELISKPLRKKNRPRWSNIVFNRSKSSDKDVPTKFPSDDSPPKNTKKNSKPRWGKPIFIHSDKSVSATPSTSKKKSRPMWSKPVFVEKSANEKLTDVHSLSDALSPGPFEETPNTASNDGKIVTPDIKQTLPEDSFSSDKTFYPQSSEHNPRKVIWKYSTVAAVLLCVFIGYLYYQAQSAEKTATNAGSQQTVVAATEVSDHHNVGVEQKDIKRIHEEEVRTLLNKWIQSWESGEINHYSSFYDSDFHSKGVDLNAWISHKARVFKKSKDIKITMDDLRISVNGDKAAATFIQNYQSSINRDSGKKTLDLRKVNNEWKIFNEIM
jgi:hypothetical protein